MKPMPPMSAPRQIMRATGRGATRFEQCKIANLVLDTNGRLVPVVERHIDGADPSYGHAAPRHEPDGRR